jgi:hypothetical protein
LTSFIFFSLCPQSFVLQIVIKELEGMIIVTN